MNEVGAIEKPPGEAPNRHATPAASDPLPEDHPPVPTRRIGILLINLGTPDGTDYWSMRRYLAEFLTDRRVIDYPAWLWQPLLQLVILTKRPFSSGKAYSAIWNTERDESPLRTITRSQAGKLANRFADRHPEITVDWAMRYGNPSIATALDRLTAAGCDRVALMALYPQYAAPTTASAYDKAFEALMTIRRQPAIRTMGPYHDDPRYIELLAKSVERHLAGLDWTPDRLIMSYHGVPKRFLTSGDPYHCMCHKTTRLVRERLGWDDERVMLCFQSRFGAEEWLQPYFDQTLEHLPKEGVKKIAVISPAFVADCVETLEEIDLEGRHDFLAAGGEEFTYIPCLNDDDAHIDFLRQRAEEEIQGWI